MKDSKRAVIGLVTAIVALTFQASAYAGSAEVVSADGHKMQFEYQDEKLRINTEQGEESYMILRDGHMYVVSNSDGNLMVIDANQAMGMFGNMAGAAAPDSIASEMVSLEATGRKEQHAGIEGEVYQLRYLEESGKEVQAELVLADDDRARAFSDTLNHMAMTMAQTVGKDYKQATTDMQMRLDELNMGVLRYGEDMRVTALSDAEVQGSRFELPAEPTDLSALGSIMGQGQQGSSQAGSKQQSGGVMSSFLGALNKSGGQSKEDSTDEADEKSDGEQSGIGKTLGKLFGK